ncbi:MAG: hypothetical protein EOO50_01640 [Flavobacterium sp.]|uniref:hypothetical protein n=1 Tax=Flavobacterium sp. TaxID=239 RepID=UPI00122A73D1|nr:hypothetical protein [Flavobacterium sp.]RZJ68520.1 MAG: hypothetical protein EOO50_01640 [Flavobacterium sp.]
MFEIDGDYGHSGFQSPQFSQQRFDVAWFHSPFVHYANYLKHYDSIGFLTRETWFYKNDEIVGDNRYEYDNNQNLISNKDLLTIFSRESKRFYFDDDCLLRSSMTYYSDDPKYYSYTQNIYDQNANLIEERKFWADGSVNLKMYKYDARNRRIAEYKQDKQQSKSKSNEMYMFTIAGNENMWLKCTWKYDEQDTQTESWEFREDGSSVTIKTKYNRNNLKSAVAVSYDFGSTETKYRYDKNDLLLEIESTFEKFPQNDLRILYEYNDDKTVRKLTYTKGTQIQVTRYTYEYDERRNWTLQTKIVDDVPLYKLRRQLTYY